MSNKNEVFEYLIDQLRQQVNKKDVTSFNVSVQISDLDEVKQVIHNLQQHIAGRDDEIRALKDTLRQQMANNPHKQQCEGLAHEVQSLKSELARYKKPYISEGQRYVVGEHGPEQSGCRKEDVQECDHDWIIAPGLFIAEGHKDNVPGSQLCCKCGVREWDDNGCKPKANTQKCKHEWVMRDADDFQTCSKCGAMA